eukprot:TRINITY_DN1113_c0_g1_i1.p1 TRINITY_DN1113_c0_g1~~TRINITY_DN1113_c0_g1_i1.p1  ORF type:complete len:413 (+),score=21.73 TRINITY_DN1113_c0_g1_i1:63-1301(+)
MDSYVFDDTIGSGAFGVVKKGYRRRDKNFEIAAKFVENADDGLIDEIALLRAATHPNVVQILDDFPDGSGGHVIVMELCPDGDCGRWARSFSHNRVPVDQFVPFLIKLLSAVEFVHEQNIIHRDIKPGNILRKGNEPKLADFGVSRQLGPNSMYAATLAGTTLFAAPEVLEERGYCRKVDLWSVGATAYILLVGKPLFTARELYRLNPSWELPRLPADLRVPAALEAALRAMLAFDPINRPSAQRARSMLTGIRPDPLILQHVCRRQGCLSAPVRGNTLCLSHLCCCGNERSASRQQCDRCEVSSASDPAGRPRRDLPPRPDGVVAPNFVRAPNPQAGLAEDPWLRARVVPYLQALCTSIGVQHTGVKAVLIRRIQAHRQRHPMSPKDMRDAVRDYFDSTDDEEYHYSRVGL